MKKIMTEHELANRSAGLREKMAQLARQQTDEGWFDDAVGGVKKFFSSGQKPTSNLAGPSDTFIKDQNGDWIENPDKAQASNPYASDPAQAAIYAAMSPADQQWATKGGGKPDLTDKYIAMRAPNGFKPVAKAAASGTPVQVTELPPLAKESVSYRNEQTLVRIVENLNEYIKLVEGAASIVPAESILKANQLVWSPDSNNGKRFGGKDLEKNADGRWCADGYCIFQRDYIAILDKTWFDKNSTPTTSAKTKTPAFEPGIDTKNTGSWDSKQLDYKGTVQAQAIQHANNIANVNSIVVGKTLDIPGVGTYKIAPGDTLDAIAAGRYKKPDNLQKSDSGIWNNGPDQSEAEKQRNLRKNFNARDQSTRDEEERLHQIRRDDNWQNGPNQHEPEKQRLGMNESVGFQADEFTRIVSLIHYK